MKKIFLYAALPFVFALSACQDVLDAKIDGDYGDNYAWNLPDKAQGVLYLAYDAIPKNWDSDYSGVFLDAATDNAVTGDLTSNIYDLAQGGISNSNNPVSNWKEAYKQFYHINSFLERGLGSNVTYKLSDNGLDAQYKRRLKGEAYFLRAWWATELLKVYGGVSDDGEALGYRIVTSTAQQLDKNLTYRRDAYEVCVKQILADCDTAFANLPVRYEGNNEVVGEPGIGRADGRAALALKSRVAIFAASKAYQPSGTYAISEDSVAKKWKRAAVLSQEAITKANLGVYTSLTADNFNKVSTTPDEFLFRRYTNNRDMESRNYPPLFRGRAVTQPSQNLVDAFPDINGFPITDPRSLFIANNPYENRDPRLDLNVYYNGRTFDGRMLEIYKDANSGAPARDAAGYDFRNSRTGYYLRKWLSQKSGLLNEENPLNDFHEIALLRKSEVYLNYAEASNEVAGPTGLVPGCSLSALDIIKQVRAKAGIQGADPYLTERANAGKDAFRTFIQNERRLEFAFENQRYFDLRRWMLPLDVTVKGIECQKSAIISTYKEVDVESRTRLSDPKYYYSPLPYDELTRNPAMKDNKGWGR